MKHPPTGTTVCACGQPKGYRARRCFACAVSVRPKVSLTLGRLASRHLGYLTEGRDADAPRVERQAASVRLRAIDNPRLLDAVPRFCRKCENTTMRVELPRVSCYACGSDWYVRAAEAGA